MMRIRIQQNRNDTMMKKSPRKRKNYDTNLSTQDGLVFYEDRTIGFNRYTHSNNSSSSQGTPGNEHMIHSVSLL